ncbi:MAG: S66 peptidase family protein [Bacillota bacterium]
MIKPRPLKQGAMIGLTAPAGAADYEDVIKAVSAIKEMGFEIKIGESCYARHGYLAGNDHQRANELNKMFSDTSIQAIICLRGGYGTPRILDKLDYKMIKNNPKVFIGYSDITALHIAITQKSELITFHGPMAASDMGKGLDDFSKQSLIRAVFHGKSKGNMTNPEGEKIGCFVEGQAVGRITGGNLSLIASTIGTPYEIDTRNKILFLEDVGEEPYRIDRMLCQLLLARKLHDAAGIILGDWKQCEPEEPSKSLSLLEVFHEIICPLQKPTVFNVKAGHCSPMLTIPLGVKCSLDASIGKIEILEEATCE